MSFVGPRGSQFSYASTSTEYVAHARKSVFFGTY
ncbi:MAG: hypothetical protein ACI90V_011673, partial [Bacillariaceae sp.]